MFDAVIAWLFIDISSDSFRGIAMLLLRRNAILIYTNCKAVNLWENNANGDVSSELFY